MSWGPKNLQNGNRKARKEHQCWHCYRPIVAGTTYSYSTNVYDGRAYTLMFHTDCQEACSMYLDWAGVDYYDEGHGPLLDMINDGEGQKDIDCLRGHWPHVATRLEWWTQHRKATP
jgi:hypothetical protein